MRIKSFVSDLRWAVAFGIIMAVAFLGVAMGGCQTVGPSNRFDRKTAALDNPSPVTLDIADDDKRGTASGVGPAGWTTIKSDVIERFQTGSTQRDLFVTKKPDGTVQLNLSSGTDVSAKGVQYDASTGLVKIDEFSTSASGPITAHNAAYDKLVAYFQSLSSDQLDALKAEQATIQAVAPTAANVIDAIIKAATSGAVP